ncbi:MAG: stage II sporulation protein M [Patescibacteria group bacterium]|nr:stage II sporulation protein M [Patescibacteria group bacterium]
MKKLFRLYSHLFYKARFWVYFVVGLAGLWLVIGVWLAIAFPSLVPVFVEYLHKTFENILGDITAQSHLQLAWGLLQQNAVASLYDLVFGLGFGLVPIFSIAFNFFAIGFLAGPYFAPALFPDTAGSLGLFLLSILPHGIFEFPALILSAAFGLRLGWLWVLPRAKGQRWEVFKKTVIETLTIIPLVLLLLVIAAFTEAFVTTWLIQ